MKTAETGKGDDLAHLGRLDRPVVRSVLREGEMNAILDVPGLELSSSSGRLSPLKDVEEHDDRNAREYVDEG